MLKITLAAILGLFIGGPIGALLLAIIVALLVDKNKI